MISAFEVARVLRDDPPTPEQAAVIEAPLEPLLVVAGAGSGKTATMAARVVWLAVNGVVASEDVLGLTFTRKAAGELADRVRARLAAAVQAFGLTDAGQPRVATYNSFAAALVRDHGLRVGRDPDAAVISRAGAWQIVDGLLRAWQSDIDVDAAPATLIARTLALSDELRANLLTAAEAREGIGDLIRQFEEPRTGRAVREVRDVPIAALRQRLALLDLVEAYQERKHALGVTEFADQVADACRIARDAPAVGTAMRAAYRVVLLDEFQDTSVAQLGLLADLFGPGHPVLAVGDPNQAIYGWRGASAASLTGFRARFAERGRPVRALTLSTSWRNDVGILRAANAVSVPLRDGAEGGTPVPVLAARAGAGAGEVHQSVTATALEEAAAIARWVEERWSPGRSAAVLCRARKQFPALIRAFRDRGIPVTVVGLSGLLFTPEVIDLRSALEVVADPGRGDAMMRLLTNERLGMADLHALAAWSSALAGPDPASLVEAVDSPPPPGWRSPAGHALSADARARVSRLAAAIGHVRRLAWLPLPELVVEAERALGLDIEVTARAGVDPARARANLDAFASRAADYASGALAPTLAGFLDWLDAAEANENGLDIAAADVSTDAVQILTVHAAKGLEWDAVAIAGMSEGQFPSWDTRTTGDSGWLTRADELPYPLRGDAGSLPELDLTVADWPALRQEVSRFRERNLAHAISEERRLAYVAVTRARSAVLLSAARHPAGANRPASLSRFLEELSELATVPPGFGIAEAADGESTGDLEVRGSYPHDDPAGDRRDQLDAAVAAVRRAAGRVSLLGNPPGLASLEGALAGIPMTARERELAEEVRALLAEAADDRAGEAEVGPLLSASAAMELVRAPAEFARRMRRPMPGRPQPHARRGTEFHAWLERRFRRPALLGEPEDIWEADPEPAELETLKRSFLDGPWAHRVPLAVELDLETPVAGRLIRCRIDAVYREADGVMVVDWKTGREPTGGEEREHRQLQLALYRLAYARAAGLDLGEVRAAFVYVRTGVTIEAENLTEAQIEDRFGPAFATT